jgi:FMN reductase
MMTGRCHLRGEAGVSDVVVISGDPHPGSRTRLLAVAVGRGFATRRGRTRFLTVDVAELGPALLVPADGATGKALQTIQNAAVLIVATPAFQGAYSGALKVLLDHLPPNALAGVLAVPVVTADLQSLADAAEAALARVLSGLGADVVDFGLTATEAELDDATAIADQYTAAIGV